MYTKILYCFSQTKFSTHISTSLRSKQSIVTYILLATRQSFNIGLWTGRGDIVDAKMAINDQAQYLNVTNTL